MIRRLARLPVRVLQAVLGGGRSDPPAAPRTRATESVASTPPDEPAHDHQHGADCDHDHGHDHDHDHGAPSMRVSVDETPNPDARKFTADKKLSAGAKSWSSAEEAADDPLGAALFALEGVASVFLVNDFVTVTKEGSASWNTLSDAVCAAIVANG